ncbi:MAG: VWA domain-containing protein [Firmicutes bacterium]|nr:VWA domain-containing protein [Bacillota bacterium]
MKNTLTELVFLLDRSGSMAGAETDTVGSFNSVIEKQKKENCRCLVTTVLFDNYMETIHDRVPLDKIAPLTEKEYYVRGSTALLDAAGTTIDRIRDLQEHAGSENKPQQTIVVIITDGIENASRRYSYREVSAAISRMKESYDWQFLFLGADIDAAKEAQRYGIDPEYAVDFKKDREGFTAVHTFICSAVEEMQTEGRISERWKTAVQKDMQRRDKK